MTRRDFLKGSTSALLFLTLTACSGGSSGGSKVSTETITPDGNYSYWVNYANVNQDTTTGKTYTSGELHNLAISILQNLGSPEISITGTILFYAYSNAETNEKFYSEFCETLGLDPTKYGINSSWNYIEIRKVESFESES